MIEEINESDFETLLNTEKMIIADFYSKWCGPCKMMVPILEELSQKYQNITFVKIEADKYAELSEKFQISTLPTFLFITNNNVCRHLTGFIPKEKFEKEIIGLIESFGPK